MGSTNSDIYPSLFYRDAPAAIGWLERALGFQRRMVMEGPENTVTHAELTLGSGVIMVSSVREKRGWLSPLDLNGLNQVLTICVEDVDGAYDRAMKAGAHLIGDLETTDYGARSFLIQDPEGNVWSVGDYRPGEYWDEG